MRGASSSSERRLLPSRGLCAVARTHAIYSLPVDRAARQTANGWPSARGGTPTLQKPATGSAARSSLAEVRGAARVARGVRSEPRESRLDVCAHRTHTHTHRSSWSEDRGTRKIYSQTRALLARALLSRGLARFVAARRSCSLPPLCNRSPALLAERLHALRVIRRSRPRFRRVLTIIPRVAAICRKAHRTGQNNCQKRVSLRPTFIAKAFPLKILEQHSTAGAARVQGRWSGCQKNGSSLDARRLRQPQAGKQQHLRPSPR